MKTLLWINHVLITLFAITSGLFKVLGGKADIVLFAKIGMTPALVALFGAVQVAAGIGLLFGRSTRLAAAVLVACNALATAGLFVAGVQPFGIISILFVGMALLELRLSRAGLFALPEHSSRKPTPAR